IIYLTPLQVNAVNPGLNRASSKTPAHFLDFGYSISDFGYLISDILLRIFDFGISIRAPQSEICTPQSAIKSLSVFPGSVN
ncbi:MAG: hypothetical protein Q7J16_11695, partial [Candidatus Cloacimonadales bacterium]|nr:hypothetical protein [Candidatus Cloacimonadales bacterium]